MKMWLFIIGLSFAIGSAISLYADLISVTVENVADKILSFVFSGIVLVFSIIAIILSLNSNKPRRRK